MATRSKSSAAGYSKRSRIDKLGVKPGARVALVALDESDFLAELATRTQDVSVGRPGANTDMILFAVEGVAALRRLATLQKRIRREGAIWVIWPKRQKLITETMIRAAALEHGLVDIKVMAFSERLSGLKLVIPVARR